MLKRSILLSAVLILAIYAISMAAPPIKPIPLYPGAKINMETNLTDKDFLPIIRQWIGAIPSIITSGLQGDPEMAKKLANDPRVAALQSVVNEQSMKDLEAAISGLKSITAIDCTIPKSATDAKVSAFYMQKMGLSKGWTLTLRSESPMGRIRLYTKQDFESFFGFLVSPGRVDVFRTQGKVDLVTLTNWITKIIPMVMSAPAPPSVTMPAPEPAAPAAPTPAEPAPAPTN